MMERGELMDQCGTCRPRRWAGTVLALMLESDIYGGRIRNGEDKSMRLPI
jgi:hypothetical protein